MNAVFPATNPPDTESKTYNSFYRVLSSDCIDETLDFNELTAVDAEETTGLDPGTKMQLSPVY